MLKAAAADQRDRSDRDDAMSHWAPGRQIEDRATLRGINRGLGSTEEGPMTCSIVGRP